MDLVASKVLSMISYQKKPQNLRYSASANSCRLTKKAFVKISSSCCPDALALGIGLILLANGEFAALKADGNVELFELLLF